MKDIKETKYSVSGSILTAACLALLALPASLAAQSASPSELEQRIAELEQELSQARSQLQQAQMQTTEAEDRAEAAETQLANAADTGPSKIQIGNFSIGGAIRANYVWGDYTDPSPGVDGSRGDNGTIQLDIFRINVDYDDGNLIGKLEYRWYPGYRASNADSYSMPHTAWLGMNVGENGQVQVGLNRVPFGPGAYGISQSWFFDQHYYVGLADDMDVGIKYATTVGDLKIDFGYYIGDEGSWTGEFFSSDSVRYSYDVVNESGGGYEESHQFNFRVIKPVELGDGITSEVGLSLQYGQLDSEGPQSDGDHYAASVHAVTQMGNWKLATQLTKYNYDVEADQPMGTDKLVQFGAFDFATLVAAEAWIAGASLSYYKETADIAWLDYVIPYIEYSSIIKDEGSFNESNLLTLGAAWGRGGWYIYTEYALSNGNDFVGNEGGYGSSGPADLNGRFASNRFGANPNDDWQHRFNLNFGYYF